MSLAALPHSSDRTKTIRQDEASAGSFSFRTRILLPPTDFPAVTASIVEPNGSSPRMQMSKSEPAAAGGHSTNFVKLKRKAAFTAYSSAVCPIDATDSASRTDHRPASSRPALPPLSVDTSSFQKQQDWNFAVFKNSLQFFSYQKSQINFA